MEYKLFDDYITLQALLKEVGIIQSGGAIKSFLQENQVILMESSKLAAERKFALAIPLLFQIKN